MLVLWIHVVMLLYVQQATMKRSGYDKPFQDSQHSFRWSICTYVCIHVYIYIYILTCIRTYT